MNFLKILFVLLLIFPFKAGAQTSALAIADSLYAVGNYPAAIEELQNIAPKSQTVLIKLAQAQKANGTPLAALETYEKVLAEDPGKVVTAVEYARLLSATGRLKEADSIFTVLTKEFPANANFHYQLGLVREKQKDSTAMRHYRFAVVLQRTHQQALLKVSRSALSRGKLFHAEQLCKQGLEANPANISLLSILAQAYYHMKEYELAATQFEKIVDLGAGSEFVHTKLGTAYFHLEDLDKAIVHFNRALDYEDQNPATHYRLGKLYALKGEYKNSEGHLLQALLLKDVLLDEELTSLGLTYKNMEEPKKAFAYFNRAVEENPDNERAMFERAMAADSYYKDLETRRNYYLKYLERFQEYGTPELIRLARHRVRDIREEMHMKASAN